MKFAVLCSKKDEAGMNIHENLKRNENFSIHLLEKESIFSENIDRKIKADFFIFATKHQGKEHRKNFSVHAPGNFSKAIFGGKSGKLCKTSAFLLKKTFLLLNKNCLKGWKATLEVTHHGPYLNKPCMFIEIGTTKEEWKNREAGKIIAKTIRELVKFENKEKWKAAIALGGPHYCPNFNKIQLKSNIALSHICPNYSLSFLNKNLLKQMIEKTIEKPNLAILDWKGLGKSEERNRIIRMLEEQNLKYLKTREIN